MSDSASSMDFTGTRLLVVSSRLPVTIKKKGSHEYEYHSSSGGLAAGLGGLARSMNFQWFGWTGDTDIPGMDIDQVRETLRIDHNAVPIFLEKTLSERYYNGFSNSVLWPILHYSPEKMSYDDITSTAYRQVNESFAEQMIPHIKNGDVIWVHDYHLLLLPSLLRDATEGKVKVKIGFFLHTPFPSSDFFSILPSSRDALQSLLKSDLVGFHIDDYTANFKDTCAMTLGAKVSNGYVEYRDMQTRVGTYPIGIDPNELRDCFRDKAVKESTSALSQHFEGVKVIVGVDRMDYIKGVPLKLQALDRFLDKNPEWVGRITLVQVAVPSRPEVMEYQSLRKEVNGLVGHICGKYGSLGYTPVHFMHKSISKEELVALYAISDICLISSTRDGMNLVSFEYIACQNGRHGNLIMSKFAGAQNLLDGALIINPWNTTEICDAIHEALNMDQDQRDERYKKMEKVVNNLTSFYWGKSFLQHLQW